MKRLTKKHLIALIKGKGNCQLTMCVINCMECIIRDLSFESIYEMALEMYIRRYGEAALFEMLL